ncbi:Cuticle protein 10.9 [Nymphon striatum]|nr:Cuticle protein 10.9 [Nymphon striatum]
MLQRRAVTPNPLSKSPQSDSSDSRHFMTSSMSAADSPFSFLSNAVLTLSSRDESKETVKPFVPKSVNETGLAPLYNTQSKEIMGISSEIQTHTQFAALCLLVVSVYGSRSYDHPRQGYGYAPSTYETYDKPAPYEFSYEIVDDYYNTQARQESGDEYGYKTGSYSMKNAEGLERIVEYIADEAGFRAVVKTNEPGTDNQNPADVEITATPVEVKEAPKKVVKEVHVAPSYGHRAYAAPSYGHRAHGYGTPAYGQTHGYGNYERNYGRTHQYEAKKPHGIKATGHASTTYSAGYGNDGYKHSVAKVHSRRYEAPTYGYSAHAAPSYRHAAPAYGYGYKPVAVKVVKEEKKEEVKEVKEEKKEEEVKEVRRYY